MMGLSRRSLWISYFIHYFIMFSISVWLVVIALWFPFGPNGAIMNYSRKKIENLYPYIDFDSAKIKGCAINFRINKKLACWLCFSRALRYFSHLPGFSYLNLVQIRQRNSLRSCVSHIFILCPIWIYQPKFGRNKLGYKNWCKYFLSGRNGSRMLDFFVMGVKIDREVFFAN